MLLPAKVKTYKMTPVIKKRQCAQLRNLLQLSKMKEHTDKHKRQVWKKFRLRTPAMKVVLFTHTCWWTCWPWSEAEWGRARRIFLRCCAWCCSCICCWYICCCCGVRCWV